MLRRGCLFRTARRGTYADRRTEALFQRYCATNLYLVRGSRAATNGNGTVLTAAESEVCRRGFELWVGSTLPSLQLMLHAGAESASPNATDRPVSRHNRRRKRLENAAILRRRVSVSHPAAPPLSPLDELGLDAAALPHTEPTVKAPHSGPAQRRPTSGNFAEVEMSPEERAAALVHMTALRYVARLPAASGQPATHVDRHVTVSDGVSRYMRHRHPDVGPAVAPQQISSWKSRPAVREALQRLRAPRHQSAS